MFFWSYPDVYILQLAVPDLKKAFELSPDDETIANTYRYPAVIIVST